jgi:hypothetical protein
MHHPNPMDAYQAQAQGLGLGFPSYELSPEALWALHQGSAWLRLQGLSSLGFRALGWALQTTSTEVGQGC